MKKLMMFAVATMLVSGAAFAGGKKCSKEGKDCCKKETKACCKDKKDKKDKKG